jgi:uncharacterized Zn finger protein
MTVFEGVVDATFAAFRVDAVYSAAGGEPISVRVIAREPDAAEAMEEKFPEAATLLYRRMVESVLERGSSKQYRYAARDLQSCARLAPRLPVPGSIESHAIFVARLQKAHGRKYGFWGLIEQKGR